MPRIWKVFEEYGTRKSKIIYYNKTHFIFWRISLKFDSWVPLNGFCFYLPSISRTFFKRNVWLSRSVSKPHLMIPMAMDEHFKRDHRCGIGVTPLGLLLTQRARVRSRLKFISGFCQEIWATIHPRLSYDHHISSVYGRRRSLTIAVVHGRR